MAANRLRGTVAEGIEKVKAPRRYFRVLWPCEVVSLSAANEERQKKKKNRRDQYGSTGYTRNQLRLAANQPPSPSLRQPLCAPFPGRLRRKAKSTGDAERRSHGGVRVARQPFALSSTTVMDRARLRPYHHHHHHHHHHWHVTTTWCDFKLFSHCIGIVCHVYDRQQLDRWMPCYDIVEELEELN